MPTSDNGVNYGCLFCRTGGEKSVAEELMQREPEVKVIAPVKERIRRNRGGSTKEQVLLFPGYVFFAADEAFNAYTMKRNDDVYRLLLTGEEDWRLMGEDRRLVASFFENEGVIGLSKAYYEGDRIRIADGYLKNYEGKIVRVNRRNQTAQIRMDFSGRQIELWLGFELIDKTE